jgi:predicted Rossmann fold nucleotide-binding protein DprA/Smf involved in DNA uptake
MTKLSSDTQAVLLLCGRFGERNGADPLSAGEYGRLVQWLKARDLRPAGLMERGTSADLVEAKLEPARIEGLLARGTAMALATEKWLRSGLWIVSRSDEAYPRRLKKKLGQDAPALLFGAGASELLDSGGLAIVGSRDATDLELDFARDVAARCAKDSVAVVSGGARGVDAAAMQGAGEGGGRVIGVLADSLLRASVNRDNRRGIEEGRLVLVSAFNPEAGFNAGNAMQRNRYIYALSDYALVVQSDYEKGGTWAGATENLKAGWVPLFVRDDAASKGIAGLIKRGAKVYAPGSGNLAAVLAEGMPAEQKGPGLFAPAPAAHLAPAAYVVEDEAIPGPVFLEGLPKRRVTLESGLTPIGLWLGKGSLALEIVVAEAGRRIADTDLRKAWKARLGGRAVPLLLVALGKESASVCGPSGEEPPVHASLALGQVERLCREALGMPDRHAALRYLSQALPSLETALPGLRNEGLLASHELAVGVRRRPDWASGGTKAAAALGPAGEKLLTALGYALEKHDGLTWTLRSRDRKTALAVMLDQSESAEAGNLRFAGLSPITYALTVADRENLPWVVVVQDTRIRLYPVELGKGVGRRGRSETYVECHTTLLRDEDAAYLWLLFSAEALARGGTFDQILDESGRFAGDLADRLRDRIYAKVVPGLATLVAGARASRKTSVEDLELAYEVTLTLLFRLLFIAYAEDRDLLPYKFNDAYRSRSLKTKARELAEGKPVATGDTHWREVLALFRAVDVGNSEWGVPAYNGGLFAAQKSVSPAGAEIVKLSLPNDAFVPVLKDLLLIETPGEGIGPVDFRALGVREFGTIYEGLLESELAIAEADLTVDAKGHYAPVKKKNQAVVVRKGEVYLHNRSGARKSMGSYFTKSFAVEHLLDRALEPALAEHLERVAAMDETDAAEAFFDFRVADIAMGSAHFLVAAIDRIEKGLTGSLRTRRLPGIARELEQLRGTAEAALGESASQIPIEDGPLLRRLIARRCVYGVDMNPLSVQLARLGVWIHTFVPGLPLSFLDHNFVVGNSLIGVGAAAEIRARFEAVGGGFFPVDAEGLLGAAAAPLKLFNKLTDSSKADVDAARAAVFTAKHAVAPTAALCDIMTAQSIEGPEEIQFQYSDWKRLKDGLPGSKIHRKARAVLEGLKPLHFAVAFPEVFLRKRAGFDVVLGNPPWQEVTIEEHAFWARHFPGLRSLVQKEQEKAKDKHRNERPDLVRQYEAELSETERMRKALTSGGFPGMGTGDPDVYKAFCWRFWNLVSIDGGWIGVVLPRSALAAKGSTEFRESIFKGASPVDITMVLNRGGWVFDDAEHRYTIGLVALRRAKPEGDSIALRGPYATLERYQAGITRPASRFSSADVTDWTDTASLPLLPTDESIAVFAQMRKAPRLDLDDGKSWRARPDRELDATLQKHLMDVKSEECPKGYWPVYKGETFDLWSPDNGTYYAFADPDDVIPFLYDKRLRGSKKKDSAHGEFAPDFLRMKETLPSNAARIAFRDVTRATDTRTLRVALAPPKVFIANQAPYLLWPRGDEKDQAYLLSILSSLCLDWYARRFVETHVSFFVLNPFPVPRPKRTDALWQRAVAIGGRLAAVDKRYAAWAKAVGVEYGRVEAAEKDDLIHELDAAVAHLYGLDESQLVHVFETFHEGWDYADRLESTLKHYRKLAGKRH